MVIRVLTRMKTRHMVAGFKLDTGQSEHRKLLQRVCDDTGKEVNDMNVEGGTYSPLSSVSVVLSKRSRLADLRQKEG